ncbi:MAG: hypothetical protein DWH83_01785 [Planctomycetota bacterium]|nr:MAG: hypothetical protein DWH83_01785 [Planctomycetota bacterium]
MGGVRAASGCRRLRLSHRCRPPSGTCGWPASIWPRRARCSRTATATRSTATTSPARRPGTPPGRTPSRETC